MVKKTVKSKKVFHFREVPLRSSALCSFRCVGGNMVLLIRAFRKKFVIPEFDVFAQKINEIYNVVQNSSDGKVTQCKNQV